MVGSCRAGDRCALVGPGNARPSAHPTVDTLALGAAAAYLVAECRRLGLLPVGRGGYAQELPLTQATIVPGGTTVRMTGPGVDTAFSPGAATIPRTTTGTSGFRSKASRAIADFAIEVIRRMDAYRDSSGISRTGPGGKR